MFKKLFNGIIDICKPGTDDPTCQFGVQPKDSNQHSMSAAADEKHDDVWPKEKKVGSTISGKKS